MGCPLLLETEVVLSQCYAETIGCVETKDRVGLDGCTGYGVRLRQQCNWSCCSWSFMVVDLAESKARLKVNVERTTNAE